MASMLWFVDFGMRIFGDPQLFSCAHLQNLLIFQVNLVGQRSSLGRIKHGIFLCIISFNFYNLDIQRVIHAHPPPPQNNSSSIFQDPMKKTHLTSKLAHENFTPT
jgi:hypothetical protein